MIKDMTFVSQDTAFSFYNKYAKDHGFGIRKDKIKRIKEGNIEKEEYYRRFVCYRSGKRDSKWFNLEDRSRRERPESRCRCKAHLIINLNRTNRQWYVASFYDKHNHLLARPDEVPFLRSHRKVKPYQRVVIMSLQANGMSVGERATQNKIF